MTNNQNPQNTTPDVQGFDVTPHAPAPAPAPQPQPTQQQTQQSQPQQPMQSLISFSTTAPEPQTPNAYDSIIAQQNEQIAALIAQNQALTGQITQMVQGGAQFTQQPQQPQAQAQQVQQYQTVTEFPPVYDGASPLQTFNPPSLSDNADYSLEGLASEIGKKD